MNKLISLTIIFLFIGLNTFAKTNVAKVIIMRGNVKVKQDGAVTTLKKGLWIKEGGIIQTAKKSFVKLLFIDKSSMNLGPKSKMVINKFPRKKAGIITLIKGQLRSKVTKNYMDIKSKNKSKLFIKTKTAAMGVRGTDFQVNFNPNNRNTGLITFSGAVAMAQINAPRDFRASQSNLEKVVSGPESVMVTKGQFSGVSPSQSTKALNPVKLNPAQLETLKKNDGSKFEKKSSSDLAPKKIFRSILPPGVDGKAFSNDSKELDKQIAKSIGQGNFDKLKSNIEGQKIGIDNEKSPILNGGFVDTQNIFYIQPPADAPIDPNTGMPIIPAAFGGFNPETGTYENKYFSLSLTGEFIPKEYQDGGRSPASENGKLLIPPPSINVFDQAPEEQFNPEGEFGPIDGGDFDTDEIQEEINQNIDDQQEDAQSATTKARLIFNVN